VKKKHSAGSADKPDIFESMPRSWRIKEVSVGELTATLAKG
jgi:hypothetical protein